MCYINRPDTDSCFCSLHIHCLGAVWNIALLTNKTRYSIFKIVFCVIIYIALITQSYETDLGDTITERVVKRINQDSVSEHSRNDNGQMVMVALLTL